MLFKIDKSEKESKRVTGSLDVTSGEIVVLSFSEDEGKTWTTYAMSAKILHKILTDDRETRDEIRDPDLQYRRLNGHSFEAYRPTDKKDE